jgi:hypothetical protein
VIVTRAENPNHVDDILRQLRSAVDPLPMMAQVVFCAAQLLSVATVVIGPARGKERERSW